jgi:hypothetical protein
VGARVVVEDDAAGQPALVGDRSVEQPRDVLVGERAQRQQPLAGQQR